MISKDLIVIAALSLLAPAMAQGSTVSKLYPSVRKFFPLANRFGSFQGKPSAAPVYKDARLLGYVFKTQDVAPFRGYSGEPINILMGINVNGGIVGTDVLSQHEPIFLIGIPVRKLYRFVHRYTGHQATDCINVGGGGGRGCTTVDAISSATVTSMVVNRTILQSAMDVAVSRKLVAPAGGASLAPAHIRARVFRTANWRALTGNGAIRHLFVTANDVKQAFKGMPQGEVERAHTDGAFIDLYYAYLNAPTIGRNLLGASQYRWLMGTLKPGEHAIALMANGIYSFKGMGYVRGGVFDRTHVMQNGQIILFHDLDYYRLGTLHAKGAPRFNEKAIFIIRKDYGFDPGKPWQLQLLVRRQIGALKSIYATFSGDYELPALYFSRPVTPKSVRLRKSTSAQEPIWVPVWRADRARIVILISALVLLTVILLWQDMLVRRPRLVRYVRTGYLIFTLGFMGWYALGQISVVNVFTFMHAVGGDFRWSTFLMDPMMFILWTFVAVSMLLWGRGVFCGWLCPFGALQKLVNELARGVRVRQFKLPAVVHERLWALKYVILLVLFGVSLQSVGAAERYAEVEPFKTAIIMHFQRQWPFVVYAGGLVALSLFNEKFYCKYICPLGAALAVPARLRLFSWLRRRKECGKPCQVCAHECEIQAIHETGEINVNECHYCLDCQVTYWNDHKCPPLVERRKRHHRVDRAQESVRRMEAVLSTSAGSGRKAAPGDIQDP